MKQALTILVILVALGFLGFYTLNNYIYDEKQEDTTMTNFLEIHPIEHASSVLTWDDSVIYVDPVGETSMYADQPKPDFILLTDVHGDHLNVETLEGIVDEQTTIVAPRAVAEKLPATSESGQPLGSRLVVLANGESAPQGDFLITAIPMYNLPESDDAYHVKGRGNGYIIEKDGKRVYIAGDTADIPEMRNLKNIDVAFIPMNLPYTMDVETAASAVIEFKPKKVYPYHYRGTEGLSDVNRFKQLVDEANVDVEVVLLNWYSN